MNTNHLKKFAQSARKLLLEDVSKRLLYWGIDSDGEVVHELARTSGGYLFRGEVYNDQSIPDKWNNLISAIKGHSIEDVIEEAAYTWFNRLIAIKILEKNGYDPEVLAYVSGELSDPLLLQNAKKGILPSEDSAILAELKQAVLESNDDDLFSKLLVHYCRNHHLLNNTFGHINDYTELLIPQTLLTHGGLLELINSEESIAGEDYEEVELIGWLYQFYISDKKDEVFAGFKKNKKARAEDIPAATQIFTPKWIVKYLVENTVGRIWLDLHPESPIRDTMTYLVEPENPTQDDPIIQDVTELKVLDPAVGSGHFLVVAFDLLMLMYEEEGYSKRKAVQLIIEGNLYGLDICPRASGLAIFALLLKGAKHSLDVLQQDLNTNIHSMPEPFDFQRQQIQDFLGESSEESVDEVHIAVKSLKMGRNIGSALILDLSKIARMRIEDALFDQNWNSSDLEYQMTIYRLIPFIRVAQILTDNYPAVVANPPYMGSKNMNADLAVYLKNNYPRSKSDLYAVFVDLMSERLQDNGFQATITMESWMFLSAYSKFRETIIQKGSIKSLVHMPYEGRGRTSLGINFGTVCLIYRKKESTEKFFSCYIRHFDIDGNGHPKSFPVANNRLGWSDQKDLQKIPGSPLAYWFRESDFLIFKNAMLLGNIASVKTGMTTGDNGTFVRFWFEVYFSKIALNVSDDQEAVSSQKKWFPYNKGGGFRRWFGLNESIINWENNGRDIKENLDANGKRKASVRAEKFYFQPSITYSSVTSAKFSARISEPGALFDSGGSSVFCRSKEELNIIAGLLCSSIPEYFLSAYNNTINFQPGDISRIPLIHMSQETRSTISSMVESCSNISKTDWDSHETSWGFARSPILNNSNSISKSIASWEEKVTNEFFQLHENEVSLNYLLLQLYNLGVGINSNVPLRDISILQDELDREELLARNDELLELKSGLPIKIDKVMQKFISYAIGCFMGRYRLDKPGLNIAHPNPTDEELSAYEYNGYNLEIDDDAIIPMMGSESPFSDDIVQRVRQFVLMIWGEESYTENLNFINKALGEDVEKYLTKKFWDQHKKMYKKRPIYWQFASPSGAFKVLTYMHRMNRFTVQVIRKNYLFKQMNWLEREITPLAENEATLQSKDSKRLDKLRKDLIECREYDLLLKDMADRQIEFDLDDGVVENYKLFEGVVSKI